MKSQRQLALEALTLLRVVSLGLDPAEDDMQFALARVPPLLAELRAREIVLVADYDAIPDEIFNALADLLASRIAPNFGAPYDNQDAVGRIRQATALRTHKQEVDFDPGIAWSR